MDVTKPLNELLNMLEEEELFQYLAKFIKQVIKEPDGFITFLEDGPMTEYIKYDKTKDNDDFWRGFLIGWLMYQGQIWLKEEEELTSADFYGKKQSS